MEISRPRRILAVGQLDSGLLDLVKSLTGSTPSIPGECIAGTTLEWALKTAYYSATVPIWLDEVSEPETWAAEFLAPEAREVLTVLGAFVVCFRRPVDAAGLDDVRTLLESVGRVVKDGCGHAWDGVCVAVLMPQSRTPCLEMDADDWDDLCRDSGFEFVDFVAKGRNEYSERTGVERLREALESNDWDGNDDEGEVNLDDFEAGGEDEDKVGSVGFGIDPAEMKEDMAGMKQAIYSGSIGEEDEIGDEEVGDREIQQLQAMMLKMQAVRDMGADLPEAERKRLASKTVNDIMKTL